MSNYDFSVHTALIPVFGGNMHRQEVDVDFMEGVVHEIGNEMYQCRTLNGHRILVHVDYNIQNVIVGSLSFI